MCLAAGPYEELCHSHGRNEDITFQPTLTPVLQKVIEPLQAPFGGLGMYHFRRLIFAQGLSMSTWLPFFSKQITSKHSALALFYIKVIHWHLIAFYLTVGLLISIIIWG